MTLKKNLIILDHSKMVKTIFAGLLDGSKDIGAIIYANDAHEVIEKVGNVESAIMTLDIENDEVDGFYFLERQMKSNPMPIILVSSNSTKAAEKAIRALELGAVECIERPCDIDGFRDLDAVRRHLNQAVRNAANANFQTEIQVIHEAIKFTPTEKSKKTVIALGASTGGVKAIKSIISRMPKSSPAILISQHLPKLYTHAFVEMLNRTSEMTVTQAKDEQVIRAGHAYVSPGGCNMGVVKNAKGEKVICLQKMDVHQEVSCSIDFMFSSLAKACAEDTIAVILTGAGHDGAAGMKKLKDSGAHTIAQKSSSCIIAEMPEAANQNGSIAKTADLSKMPGEILEKCS